MKKRQISAKKIQKAVAQSSKIEGLDYLAAKKNKSVIRELKKYGRAFAISR
jgi:chromosomal replication initiation ATPase DnaA